MGLIRPSSEWCPTYSAQGSPLERLGRHPPLSVLRDQVDTPPSPSSEYGSAFPSLLLEGPGRHSPLSFLRDRVDTHVSPS